MKVRTQVWLWVAQRASGAVLAFAVVTHLATVIYAVRGGLTAAEILGRVQGSVAWLLFYLLFVAAVAVHAPIGLRAILAELTPLPETFVAVLVTAFGLVLLGLGAGAAFALFAS